MKFHFYSPIRLQQTVSLPPSPVLARGFNVGGLKRSIYKTSPIDDTRLYCALTAYGVALTSKLISNPSEHLLYECCTLYNIAVVEYSKKNRDASWQLLKSATRKEIYLFDGNQCKSRAELLDKERYKLKEWRNKAVETLIKPIIGCETVAAVDIHEYRSRLEQAEEIFDSHFDNEHLRKKILRKRINPIGLGFLLIVAGLLTISNYRDQIGLKNFLSFPDMLVTILFGILGASASVANDLVTKYESSNLIKQFSEATDSYRRISFGPVAAILVVFAAKEELIPFLKVPTSIALLCCYAFVAGFSERLVVKIVEKVGGPAKVP